MKPLSLSSSVRGLPKAGELLASKYQIGEVLGVGGMGVVMAGTHVALRQRVAVKFLTSDARDVPGASARFMREAQAVVAIQSEHVTRVFDVGTLPSGAPYIVMEYLSGTNFGKLLKARGEGLPVAEAVDLVLQAAEALAEAHGLGIVHRDLKPSNLFLTTRPDGTPLVKVLDFGLLKLVNQADGSGSDEELTATSLVAGSPSYMSPEQIRSLKHVDARTDLWSLGVIFYELLTGQRPFRGEGWAATCVSIALNAPDPMRAFRNDVPEALDALVQRCLEKDLAKRVQNVGELAEGLEPFASPSSLLLIERIKKLQLAGAAARRSPDPGPISAVRTQGLDSWPGFPKVPASVRGPAHAQVDNPEFLPWLKEFEAYLRAQPAQLGFGEKTLGDVTRARALVEGAVEKAAAAGEALRQATDAAAAAQQRLSELQKKQDRLQEALATTHEARKITFRDGFAAVQAIGERIRLHDDITNLVKKQLGLSTEEVTSYPLPVPGPGSGAGPAAPAPGAAVGPAAAPSNLVAIPQPNRVYLLRWDYDGRAPGAQFVIEVAVGSIYRGVARAPDFGSAKVLAVTAENTYRHNVGRLQAGVQIAYRVRARQGGVTTGSSNEVTVVCT
jgi:serine/threonine protein kinase